MGRHNQTAMQAVRASLTQYVGAHGELPGIVVNQRRDVFIKQVIDSVRRVQFVSAVGARPIDPRRANPHDGLFDPIKAAHFQKAAGHIDEACWLVFLLVHFGRHKTAGWRYTKEVYGKLGQSPYWTWHRVAGNPQAFRTWLGQHQQQLLRKNQGRSGFGNHRKYTSMSASNPAGTGAAIESYVGWVLNSGGHQQLFQTALHHCQNDPRRAFDWLYRSMNQVASFGRTAKFDYLTMLRKIDLAQIQPGLAYLAGSTGPRAGAVAMLGAGLSTATMEAKLVNLASCLGVGMQEIEDSLCNWQKSPDLYVYFPG